LASLSAGTRASQTSLAVSRRSAESLALLKSADGARAPQSDGARAFQASGVTYARDVAPLIVDRCAMCHHPGGSAPFSLLTYADGQRLATQIAAVPQSAFLPSGEA